MIHHQPIAIVADESSMLVVNQPWDQGLLQLQTHFIEVVIRITKRNHIVPVTCKEVYLQTLLQEGRQQCYAPFFVAFVFGVYLHVADCYILFSAEGVECLYIRVEVVLDPLVV